MGTKAGTRKKVRPKAAAKKPAARKPQATKTSAEPRKALKTSRGTQQLKVADVQIGQRVRVPSHNGPRVGTVFAIKHEGGPDPVVWVTVRVGTAGFIDSMHEPDGMIELVQ